MAVSPEVQAALDKAEAINKALETKMKTLPVAAATNTPTVESVFGQKNAPHARKYGNLMGSRGFQYQRLFGHLTGLLEDEQCGMEIELTNRMKKHLVQEGGFSMARTDSKRGAAIAPFSTDDVGFTDSAGVSYIDDDFRMEMKSMVRAGCNAVDRDQLGWILNKGNTRTPGWDMKASAQSWIDETLGGSLVAPPEFGELIQLFRNKDALINAGARVVPLPPSGRLKYPRQTAATTGYFIGEGQTVPPSNFNTGSLILSAKKCAVLVVLNDELIRFASPASEAILRADMTKTLSLTVDYYALQGVGSDNVPLGLVNTPNIATIAPTTAASGNTGALLSPQDLFTFIASIEANNAEFQGYILRPELFYALVGARAGVYNGSATVAQGQFVNTQFRELGQGFGPVLAGFKATTTPQVDQNRVQGTNKALTYVVGGQWDDFILAMFGSIEFAQATQSDTWFAQDQTAVRGILTMDSAPRHPGAFGLCDKLQLVVGP